MTVEEAVRARLLSLSDVTALVSTRVYLDRLPQTPTYPCVRVTLIDDNHHYQLRGESGLSQARVQVESFAIERSGVDPYALAAAVSAAIRGDGDGSALSGWKGTIGSPAFKVAACFADQRTRNYDPAELRVVRICDDYRIAYLA